MKKAFVALGVVAGAGVIAFAGLTPSQTANFLHSRWSDNAPQAEVIAFGADIVPPPPEEADATGTETTAPPEGSGRFADLMRIGPEYEVSVAPTVSREVLSHQVVTKISYGNMEHVQIVTTPTGVYSSDGLKSPNVLYPGITVRPREYYDAYHYFLSLVRGHWVRVWPSSAGSFVHYGSGFGGRYKTNGHTTCVSGQGYYGCY